jgi:two-component system nitrogen regulation response regulator GlnG
VLLPESLPASLRGTPPAPPAAGEAEEAGWGPFLDGRLKAGAEDLYAEWQARTDRFLFRRVLRHTGGNLSQAARILGIHRSTLRARIEALGLTSLEAPTPGKDRGVPR